jgi:hypothetical protein
MRKMSNGEVVAMVIVRNAPHPNHRERDRCSLEWIHREALWRCHWWENSVRHFIPGTKIWRPTRTFWDRKIHKITGTKNVYEIHKRWKQETCAILRITYGISVCENITRTCFIIRKPCAKHTCSRNIMKSPNFRTKKIPTSRGYLLILSQFT